MLKIYSAKWVIPISSQLIEDGAVAIEEGRIIGVGTRALIKARFTGAEEMRIDGEAAIMPGLVNGHTHLELTAMRGFLEREEGDFFAWLRKLTLARLERMTIEDLYVSAACGAVEALRAGITCVGDASDAARASVTAVRDAGLRGTVYQESFGPDPTVAQENFAKLCERVANLHEFASALVRIGVSPHAPYSVSAPQLELIADYALEKNLPLMMHAAESRAESLFVREGRGPFAESYARRGLAWRAHGISPIQYLARCGVLRTRPLLSHCVAVDDEDLQTLHEWDARIAHCPKSNAKFGHGRAPLRAFMKRGIIVGLGSDSVASNNTCDMLEEARFAVLLARVGKEESDLAEMLGAEDALRLATEGGARALGLENEIGALAEGMQGDLIAVKLDGAHQIPVYDPVAALVFSSSARDVVLTLVAGREVYRDGRVTTLDEDYLRALAEEIKRKLS